jgi:hypothetical protein
VKEEVEGLVPALQEAVRLAVAPLQASLDRVAEMQEEAGVSLRAAAASSAKEENGAPGAAGSAVDADALAAAVDAPLRAAVASHVRGAWIPALESVASRVLAQVSAHLREQEASRREEARKEESRAEEEAAGSRRQAEALSQQLSAATEMAAQLASEVQALRASVAASQESLLLMQKRQQAPPPPPPAAPASLPSPPAAPAVSAPSPAGVPDPAARAQILAMLQARQYESAFTLAVTTTSSGGGSATGGDGNGAAVFCCSQAPDDARSVSSQLSQPILLCLMQQLGTSLVVPATARPDVSTELAWLLEIAMALDPANSQIRAHVPGVLRQVLTGINARMGRDDPRDREPLRRLLQVVRGMQVG